MNTTAGSAFHIILIVIGVGVPIALCALVLFVIFCILRSRPKKLAADKRIAL